MKTLAALLCCMASAVSSAGVSSPAASSAADAEGPELRSWVLSPSTNAAIRSAAPEVHSVRSDNTFVYLESAGLSLHSFGALETNQYEAPLGLRALNFRIPRHPKPAEGTHASTPLGVIGVFVTGVPIYNPIGTASFNNQNIWHQDAVAGSKAGASQLVAAIMADATRHSPIIGFALDGYPIYGPYGWDEAGKVKRMASSYQLRKIAGRIMLPDGTMLTPGQVGPDVSRDYPLGTFAEDYGFVAGSGDLDEYNGRFTRTPEYPDGTYAYFLSTWPYLIGPRYYGAAPFETPQTVGHNPVELIAGPTVAGEPTKLALVFHDPQGRPIRFLEKVHEQPIHLIVVSRDLEEFAHLHPEPAPGDVFTVTHTFAHGGSYTLYADYTAPGAAPAIAKFEINVGAEGPVTSPPLPDTESTKTVEGVHVVFNAPQKLKVGQDIPISFDLDVRDLQPWLGAWAHIMLVSADRETFVHAHPLENAAGDDNPVQHVHTAPLAGPSPATISTVIGFRHPGVYKLWLQFQRHGSIVTIPWVIQVSAADRPISAASPNAPFHVRVSSAGFEPSRLVIPANQETQVAFTRLDAQNCASEVVFPDLGIRAKLPPGESVLVDLPPTKTGEFTFGCGMGMYKGALVVR